MQANSDTAVELHNVSFTYNGVDEAEHISLYDGFDLHIRRGCVTAIMGASGSGKSTLGKLLGGELIATNGAVSWSPELTSELDHFYIDQDPKKVFFPRQTVRENVAYPPRKRKLNQTNGWVDKLLDDFKLTPLADRYPLFTSGGQQSRLALARVLSWKPKCIILDEYLSSLDVNTRELVIANLHQLAADFTTSVGRSVDIDIGHTGLQVTQEGGVGR